MAKHVCPWWIGYFLMNPMRRFVQNPVKILAPYVRPGMTVLELGPGMGFFTLDLARLVGAQGRVITVDVQQRMLTAIERRAAKAGLLHRIEPRLAGADNAWANDLSGRVDFVLAFYMLHEVPDVRGFLTVVRETLVPQGALLIVEPKMHVSGCAYAETVAAAEKAGFKTVDYPRIIRSRSVLMARG